MPEPALFEEIILPEQEEADPSISVEPMQFDEIVLPHASGQFEEIIIPPKPKTETEKALAETPKTIATPASPDPVRVNSQAELDALPVGTRFILPDGRTGRHWPTLNEVGVLPKEIMKGVIRYATPPGWAQLAAEKLSPDALATKVGAGLIEGGSEALSSFTTPENLSQLAIMPTSRIAQIVLNLGMGAEAATHLPEQIKAYAATDDPQEKAKIAAGIVTSIGLPTAGVVHGAMRKAPVRPDVALDAVTATPERVVPGTPQGAEPAAAPEAVRPSSDAAAAREAEFQRMSENLNELNKDQFLPDRPPIEPGTEAAIAEIQRRNAPSTEPIIPNEPAGTKFAEPVVRGDDSLIAETTDSIVKRTKVGAERDQAFSERAEAIERTAQGLQKGDVIVDIYGGRHVVDQVYSDGTIFTDAGQYSLLAGDRVIRRSESAGVAQPSPEIMSPGPGAASAKETLASYELRRFGKRFQETEGIDPAIREQTGNQYYEPISNKLTFEEAGRIIEERGTDNAIRLVRDESFAMEPRVRATLAQTLVTKLNQSHAEATAAGDAPRAKGFLDQAVDTAEYLGEFGTRLGQGVQSFAIWSKLTPEGMLESAKRSAKRANVEMTPEQMAEIRRLAQEAFEAKEGIPKQDATKKLAKYMVEQTGIPAGDLPLSIYYTHILSGVQTHIVNAVDTGLNVLHEVNNLAISNPKAAASIYAGLMRGIGEGKADGLLSLQEGRRIVEGKFIESPDLLEVSTFGEKGGVPIADKGRVSRATKRIAESKIAKPLNAYKYVMRMMSASDAVWFRGAEEARAGLLAHRLAEATGVERAKLKSEVDSILGYDRLPEFRAEAAREGYTGAKAEARATELMIQSRPESLRADTSEFAGVSTYNHASRGVLGYLSNQVAQMSNKYPALKLFVPFTRIVANVTNRGLDNTPMGIVRALREKGLSKEERQRVLTRGIMGTTGMIGLGVLNATGAIEIHGAGPPDYEKKRQLQSAGWKPFSIKIGDNYYTYTYTPIGLGVSVLGNYLDSQRYKTMGEKDALTRATYAMSRIGQTVFSQSFLSGLTNFFTILSGDPGRSISATKQFFSNVATAATTPNLIRDINHLFDPTARKSESIAQDLIRNIPVARLNLRPTLNAFGEPVILSRNRFFSGQSDDPAWRVVVDKNLRVPTVDQTTFEDSEDGYLYAKIAGERMRKYIVSNLTMLNRATDQRAQDMLSKASRAMFDEARQDVVRHGGVKKKKRKP